MSHLDDYMNALCEYAVGATEQERQKEAMWIPAWVFLTMLWDAWDFITWPIRRLRRVR